MRDNIEILRLLEKLENEKNSANLKSSHWQWQTDQGSFD